MQNESDNLSSEPSEINHQDKPVTTDANVVGNSVVATDAELAHQPHLTENPAPPPFPDFSPAGDFPIDALPEIIQGAVREVCENDKVPGAVAVQSALSVVSLVCQDLLLVERAPGLRSVASLFMLAVAGSGVRKTQVDNAFLAPVHEYDQQRNKEYREALESQKSQSAATKLEEKFLLGRLKKLLQENETSQNEKKEVIILEIGRIKEKLADLHSQMKPKRLKRLLYSEVSVSTLERRLGENWPAAGLFSNEAADILGARRSNDWSRLDRLWEGQPINIEFPDNRESVYVADPRLTVSLMIQPEVFDRFQERKGDVARDIGFLARVLICRPIPLFGQRIIALGEARSTYWLAKFHERITQVLTANHSLSDATRTNRVVLTFSPAAQKRWVEDYNDCEAAMRKGAEFADETDFGSRYSEHVARVAALLHFFEEWNGATGAQKLQIQMAHLENAIQICQWYRKQFQIIFNKRLALEGYVQDTRKKLFEMLCYNIEMQLTGEDWSSNAVSVSFLMGRVHPDVRLKKNFEPVRAWLEENGIMVFYHLKSSGKKAGSELVKFTTQSSESRELRAFSARTRGTPQ